MKFEIINNEAEQLKKVKSQFPAIITIKDRTFYFSVEAARLFDMRGGRYLHLVRGKDDNGKYNGYWYFIVNDDKTGFRMASGSHDAIYVCKASAVRLFTLSAKCKKGDSFYVQETEHTLQGCPVIEILTHKTVQQLEKEWK